jgi:hypothetical protein
MVKDGRASASVNVTPFTSPMKSKIDAVACYITLGSHERLGVLCLYRPPDSSPDDNLVVLRIITNFLNNNFSSNIIVGDFNFPDINWPCKASSAQARVFLNFCQEKFLTQHVLSMTRKMSNSTLDLVFSTYGTQITNLSVNEEFGSSDHSTIQFSIKLKSDIVRNARYRRNFKKADWNRFQQLLLSSSAEWENSLLTKDINFVWDQFVTSVSDALDEVAPYKKVSLRSLRSCSKVRTALRHKRRAFHAFTQTPSILNLIAYEKSKMIAENVLINDTRARELRIANSADPRVFWSYVNCRMLDREMVKSLKYNGEHIQEPHKVATIFNQYFSSIYQAQPTADPGTQHIAEKNLLHLELEITLRLDDIIQVLKRLPSKSSVDSDNLSYRILKYGDITMATRLLDLYSLSLEICRVPTAWKTAVVSPIHKKGPKQLVSNYRPISVTSCCCRVLERLINSQIVQFLNNNNIISDTQHGFCSGRSTDTIMLKFYDYLTDALDKNQIVDCVFFDFQKAFDTVPHHLLISRLSSVGIRGNALNWIRDFLTNRSQKVRVAQIMSDCLPVTSGVIQGSVLGPTLFNIFVNDIDKALKFCPILKYADDARIFLSSIKNERDSRQLHCNIQSDIDNFVVWSEESEMSLNVNKCFAVSFGRSELPRTYTIEGQPIPSETMFSDLGVTVSSPISFKPHIEHIIAKSFKKLAIINKVFKTKNQFTIIKLYKSFIRPSLEYASIIWSPYTQYLIDDIERVQRRMCNMIPTLRHLSYRSQLKSLKLLSLSARRTRFQLICIFKIYKGITRLNFCDFFDVSNDHRTRGHTARIRAKNSCHNYRLNFFTVSAINLWNQLSQDVRHLSQFSSPES